MDKLQVFPAPKIDFGAATGQANVLYAEREKNVRIRELLEANNALVAKVRDLRRRMRTAWGTIYFHGFLAGTMLGAFTMGTMMLIIGEYWGCHR